MRWIEYEVAGGPIFSQRIWLKHGPWRRQMAGNEPALKDGEVATLDQEHLQELKRLEEVDDLTTEELVSHFEQIFNLLENSHRHAISEYFLQTRPSLLTHCLSRRAAGQAERSC